MALPVGTHASASPDSPRPAVFICLPPAPKCDVDAHGLILPGCTQLGALAMRRALPAACVRTYSGRGGKENTEGKNQGAGIIIMKAWALPVNAVASALWSILYHRLPYLMAERYSLLSGRTAGQTAQQQTGRAAAAAAAASALGSLTRRWYQRRVSSSPHIVCVLMHNACREDRDSPPCHRLPSRWPTGGPAGCVWAEGITETARAAYAACAARTYNCDPRGQMTQRAPRWAGQHRLPGAFARPLARHRIVRPDDSSPSSGLRAGRASVTTRLPATYCRGLV